jgi:hypothetical protein
MRSVLYVLVVTLPMVLTLENFIGPPPLFYSAHIITGGFDTCGQSATDFIEKNNSPQRRGVRRERFRQD